MKKIASMVYRPQIIPQTGQMRDFQSYQVYICVHSHSDLFRRVVVAVNVFQKLIGIDENLCRNNIRFVLWTSSHIIKHKLVQAICLGQSSMELVMAQFMSTNDTKHLIA